MKNPMASAAPMSEPSDGSVGGGRTAKCWKQDDRPSGSIENEMHWSDANSRAARLISSHRFQCMRTHIPKVATTLAPQKRNKMGFTN